MPILTDEQIRNFEIRQSLRLVNSSIDKKAVDYNDLGYDIIVAWGASNTVSLGTGLLPTQDYPSPAVLALPPTGTDAGNYVIATNPLTHRELVANSVGAWCAMGREVSQLLPNNRRVLIMPLALSGAGFAENRWNPTNDLYVDTVTRVNAVLATNPNNRILCFANCMHGGSDKDMTEANYRTAWLNFTSGMRTAINRHPNLLFLIGGYPDSALALDGGARGAKQTYMRDTLIKELGNAAFVQTTGLAAIADNIHFSAASQLVIGQRMATTLINIIRNRDNSIL